MSRELLKRNKHLVDQQKKLVAERDALLENEKRLIAIIDRQSASIGELKRLKEKTEGYLKAERDIYMKSVTRLNQTITNLTLELRAATAGGYWSRIWKAVTNV